MSLIKLETTKLVKELIEKSNLNEGDLLVFGCSTSEVIGESIGSNSSIETAQEIFDGITEAVAKTNIFIAFQCCEHLNRAVVLPKAAAKAYEQVNVVPRPKAGGSLATIAYSNLENAVVVEQVKADAGMDIGGVLIGMQLKPVAVPVRLIKNKIGKANIICARTRPKFIGGERAVYNENLL